MNFNELNEMVSRQLPSAYKTLAGSRLVRRIVRRAVSGWPVPVLEQCDAGESQVVARYYTREVERAVRAEMQMGFLAVLVFSALVQEVVRILVRWWLEKNENRLAMRLLVREVRGS